MNNPQPEANKQNAPTGVVLSDLLACAVRLLKVAACPNCDGSGSTARQISSRQYVSREMAMDAGCPEMEGSLYSDDEWEQIQCQWCFEKNQLLDAYEAQPNGALCDGGPQSTELKL